MKAYYVPTTVWATGNSRVSMNQSSYSNTTEIQYKSSARCNHKGLYELMGDTLCHLSIWKR